MLTFEKLCRAWMAAINGHATDEIMALLAEDLRWVTYTQEPAGLDAAGARHFV